ncbi:MAG TPA: hypothetical protein VF765_16460 [Polyangiaceae bacterium]
MKRSRTWAALLAATAGILTTHVAAADCAGADKSCPTTVSQAMAQSGNRFPLILSMGVRSLSYAPSSHDRFDGNIQASPMGYSFNGDALGDAPLRAYGLELGADYALTPHIYVGLATAWGEGSWTSQGFQSGGVSISPRATVNSHMWLTGPRVGVRLPLGPVSFRAEVLGGAEWIDLQQFAGMAGSQMSADASTVSWLVEPRVSADLWVTPYLVVSAFAAMPEVDTQAANGGLMLAWHWRSFDGRYSGVL